MAEKPPSDEEHPLLLELKGTRVALARFQEEAHLSAVKLQRYSLDTARTHERSSRLERDNELLRAELAVLRDSNRAHDPLTSQMHVQELTLSLRKLSEKLTLTEEALLEKTTSLVNAETDSIKARVAQDAAYELGATVRGREEAGKLREWDLELKISTLEEQLRMSDAVVGEYAALVRGMEGRTKNSTDSTISSVLPQNKLDLQHMVEKFQQEHVETLQELERTRSILDVVNAKLNGQRTGEEALRAEYGRTRTELERLKIDDGTAAKMVSRYMQFSQSSTNALLSSLETLKLRHNATLSTLTSQNLALTTQLRSLEDQNEHLRTSLDDLGGEVMKEKYGRRREVALRIRMGGREERIAEGLRRWLRRGDEALRRIDQARNESSPPTNDESLHTAYEALLVMSQDAHILLARLEDGGADEETALSLSGTKAREMMARFGLEGLLDELRVETQQRLILFTKGWREQDSAPVNGDPVIHNNGHSNTTSSSLTSPVTISRKDASLPPTPTAESNTTITETAPAVEISLSDPVDESDPQYPREDSGKGESRISLPDGSPPPVVIDITNAHDSPHAEGHVPPALFHDEESGELTLDSINKGDFIPLLPPASELSTLDETDEQDGQPEYSPKVEYPVTSDTISDKSEDAPDLSQSQPTLAHPSTPSPTSITNRSSEAVALLMELDHHTAAFSAPSKDLLRFSESEATLAEAGIKEAIDGPPSHPSSFTALDQPATILPPLPLPESTSALSISKKPRPDLQVSSAEAQAAVLQQPVLVLPISDSNTISVTSVDWPSSSVESRSTGSPLSLSSPTLPNPLLLELSKVYKRYDDIQRAFRDCHHALESLKSSITPRLSSVIPIEVFVAAVNRLDDYTEDARVELEIRVSDEELLAKGYETLLSVPGALASTSTPAQERTRNQIPMEDELHKQIANFIDGSDLLVQRARESFTKKLDDVQHDIAALKRTVFDVENLSESDSETLPLSLVSPAPSSGNVSGWTSWIRGTPSRPTTPTPGSTPTFGNIMTTPKLRHSTSFGQTPGPSASQFPQQPGPEVERSRRSSFFGSLVGLGQSDQPLKSKDPLGYLGLKVPMPSFASLAPMSPGTAPMSAGPSSASSIRSPSFSSLTPPIGIGKPPMNATGSRSRTLSTMYMLGLGGKNGGGNAGGANNAKPGLPTTRSFSTQSTSSGASFQQSSSSGPEEIDDVE
ncbi:hypothetical protein CPB83DRAFT_897854 [Crepidotus variabilis]|uniref:Uncharacterized protein n=1 Tax=Crepidotus variabilis TaxID=179855 RepID=A0A9P6E865_9AGAR|nr:hypothetical protein CPB83DRAFT_897854 [Crepidotus variabilis]